MIYNTPHRKLKNKQHEPHKNRGWIQVIWKGKLSCSTGVTPRVTFTCDYFAN